MLLDVLLITLGAFVLLGMIRSSTTMALSGFANIVLAPAIMTVAWLTGSLWVAGFFTCYSINLLVKSITLANLELAKRARR